MPSILSLKHIRKSRKQSGGFILEIDSLDVQRGELVALIGPSGCGKSTALDIMAAVLRPDAGEVFTFSPQKNSYDILDLWRKEQINVLATLRRQHVGYVLQTGGLLPFLSGKDNIALACHTTSAHGQINPMAKSLGIEHLLTQKPAHMSVGERQRFAIARALVANPELILADEPVASLDPLNAQLVMQLFTKLAKERGISIVMVSHSPASALEMGFRLVSTRVSKEEDHIISQMGGLA